MPIATSATTRRSSGNITVASGGVAGIRWFEVNNATSGTPDFTQQGTYQPDNTYRWMGSTAMDGNGNLAVGFSASSTSIYPQIRYAGRLAGDPPGTLTQGEEHLFDGTGSQIDTVSRWGDYSDMTVDPVDDCTFWYTQEYYDDDQPASTGTPASGTSSSRRARRRRRGTLAGTVTDSSEERADRRRDGSGGHVVRRVDHDRPDGTYSLTLPVGTYDVTCKRLRACERRRQTASSSPTATRRRRTSRSTRRRHTRSPATSPTPTTTRSRTRR